MINHVLIYVHKTGSTSKVPTTLFGFVKCFELSIVSYGTLLKHEGEVCVYLNNVAFDTFLVQFYIYLIYLGENSNQHRDLLESLKIVTIR